MAGVVRLLLARPARLAVAWLALVGLVAVLAPVLPLPYPPDVPDLNQMAAPPSSASPHWLGTDAQGRDVLSVLVFGARTAVLLTLPAATLAALLGAVLGGAAGYWGNAARVPAYCGAVALGLLWWALALPYFIIGLSLSLAVAVVLALARRPRKLPLPINALTMGLATALDTIPRLVLVLAIAAGTGVSKTGLLALLALTAWPHTARLVRAQMLRVRILPFVEAARASGLPAGRVWLLHALPHAVQPLRTAFPRSLAGLLGLESTLSFLGVGLPPDVASWGRLLGNVRVAPEAWWTFVFPGACLVLTILSLYALSRSSFRPPH